MYHSFEHQGAKKPVDDTGHDRDQTLWQRYSPQRRAIAGGIAGVAAIGSTLLDVVQWPAWVLLGLTPVASVLITARLTASISKTLAAGLVALIVGIAGVIGYDALESGPGSGTEGSAAVTGTPRVLPWEVPLGATPRDSVIYEDLAWTLTNDGRLVATSLTDHVKLNPIPVPITTRDLMLCGSYLVLLTVDGVATVREAERGKVVAGPYDFGDRAYATTCSTSWAWIVRGSVLVRLSVPELGRKPVETRKLHQGVDLLSHLNDHLWALDDQLGVLVGYDPVSINARVRLSLTDGASDLLAVGRRVFAIHRSTSCMRTVSFSRGREVGPGVPLSDPAVSASDGASAAIVDYKASAVTLIADRSVKTYELPLKEVRVAGLAIDHEWLIISDAAGARLLVFARSELARVKQISQDQLSGCR